MCQQRKAVFNSLLLRGGSLLKTANKMSIFKATFFFVHTLKALLSYCITYVLLFKRTLLESSVPSRVNWLLLLIKSATTKVIAIKFYGGLFYEMRESEIGLDSPCTFYTSKKILERLGMQTSSLFVKI